MNCLVHSGCYPPLTVGLHTYIAQMRISMFLRNQPTNHYLVEIIISRTKTQLSRQSISNSVMIHIHQPHDAPRLIFAFSHFVLRNPQRPQLRNQYGIMVSRAMRLTHETPIAQTDQYVCTQSRVSTYSRACTVLYSTRVHSRILVLLILTLFSLAHILQHACLSASH